MRAPGSSFTNSSTSWRMSSAGPPHVAEAPGRRAREHVEGPRRPRAVLVEEAHARHGRERAHGLEEPAHAVLELLWVGERHSAPPGTNVKRPFGVSPMTAGWPS